MTSFDGWAVSSVGLRSLPLLLFRFYEKAKESNLPDVLKECMGLFHSEAMFLLLSNFTGLKLHFLAPLEDDETEDKGEGETASAAGGTEEGTSQSPPGPEDNQAAVGSHSQENGEQADPEAQEDEAKKGKLVLGLAFISTWKHSTDLSLGVGMASV